MTLCSSAAGDIAADTITAGQIAAGAVGSSEILDGTVSVSDVAQSVWSGSVHQAGLLAARPAAAASNAGFLYYATDDNSLWRSDGTTWTKVSSSSSSVTSAEIVDGSIYSAGLATDKITAVNFAA